MFPFYRTKLYLISKIVSMGEQETGSFPGEIIWRKRKKHALFEQFFAKFD